MSLIDISIKVAALVGLCWLFWKIGHDGLPAVWRSMKTVWNRGKADLQGLHSEVDQLKADVAGLQEKLGISNPPPAPPSQ